MDSCDLSFKHFVLFIRSYHHLINHLKEHFQINSDVGFVRFKHLLFIRQSSFVHLKPISFIQIANDEWTRINSSTALVVMYQNILCLAVPTMKNKDMKLQREF